jgi:hypothetical protein
MWPSTREKERKRCEGKQNKERRKRALEIKREEKQMKTT